MIVGWGGVGEEEEEARLGLVKAGPDKQLSVGSH